MRQIAKERSHTVQRHRCTEEERERDGDDGGEGMTKKDENTRSSSPSSPLSSRTSAQSRTQLPKKDRTKFGKEGGDTCGLAWIFARFELMAATASVSESGSKEAGMFSNSLKISSVGRSLCSAARPVRRTRGSC
jgi:hypothetical protein